MVLRSVARGFVRPTVASLVSGITLVKWHDALFSSPALFIQPCQRITIQASWAKTPNFRRSAFFCFWLGTG